MGVRSISRMITIKELINIGKIIKEDNLEWVNDSHSESEYEGICYGINAMIRHCQLMEEEEVE
jgi:hypothetical protein